MDSSSNGTDAKWRTLRSLGVLYPWMRPYFFRPVRAYARRLFEPPVSKALPECRVVAFNKLLDILSKAANRCRLPAETIGRVCRDFSTRRVLQTGPHLHLILEPQAYCTHAFSLLGLSANGSSTYVSYAVSTVSLVESSRKGPGWLTIDGTRINVFGLSRSRMVGYGLLTARGPYRFELVPAEPELGRGDGLSRLRDLMPPAQFEKPAHAIKAANLVLWQRLFGSNCAFLQIDDEDVADLVADHLSDEGSWLFTRLFETPRFTTEILDSIDRVAAGPWAGWLTRGTDFFWLYENGRRVALRLSSGNLIHATTGARVARFRPSEIIERLRSRSLVPNMFLAFLVLAILPAVRVLGGSHQPIYYPLMRYVIARAMKAAGLDDGLQRSLALDDLPGAWGHRVIEGNMDPVDLLAILGTDGADSAFEHLGDTALIEACANMDDFVQDPAWRDLSSRLEARLVSNSDLEWALS